MHPSFSGIVSIFSDQFFERDAVKLYTNTFRFKFLTFWEGASPGSHGRKLGPDPLFFSL